MLAWAGLIFAFSAQPDLRFLEDEFFDFVLRKVGHAGVFGILALLGGRYPSPVDVGIDSVGALVAIGIVLAVTARGGRASRRRGGVSRHP